MQAHEKRATEIARHCQPTSTTIILSSLYCTQPSFTIQSTSCINTKVATMGSLIATIQLNSSSQSAKLHFSEFSAFFERLSSFSAGPFTSLYESCIIYLQASQIMPADSITYNVIIIVHSTSLQSCCMSATSATSQFCICLSEHKLHFHFQPLQLEIPVLWPSSSLAHK
jgi:hypothetical protein